MNATTARALAKQILATTIFSNVKVAKGFKGYEININGGRAACYGRTCQDKDDVDYILEVFAKDAA